MSDGPLPNQSLWSAASRVGRYELLGRIATGGMAEIYLARARGIEGFEKLVVLKRMLPQYAADDAMVRLFLDEARLSATLEHPNIAQVYDIGLAAGESYFFTMEHIHGADMRQVVARATESSGLPLAQAVTVVLGAAAGLHYAHEKRDAQGQALSVVHRDVSPSNILLSFDGAIKLVDFGIARVATKQSSTEAGFRRGKASYMSPEQCRGEPLDRRSDVFALGIMLWEFTVGQRLFDGQDPLVTLRRIADTPAPSPFTVEAAYPADLEPIVMRALAYEREARYESAQALQLDLEEWARERRLPLSLVELSSSMRSWFAGDFHAWSAASRDGQSLAQHLTGTTSAPNLPAESVLAPVREPTEEPASTEAPPKRRVWLVAAAAVFILTSWALWSAIGPAEEAQTISASTPESSVTADPESRRATTGGPQPVVTAPAAEKLQASPAKAEHRRRPKKKRRSSKKGTRVPTRVITSAEPAPVDSRPATAPPAVPAATTEQTPSAKKATNWDPDSPLPR